MFSNEPASLLITGTTCAPPLTGKVPPSTKQFWTSTTISADAGPGLMVPAARNGRDTPSATTAPTDAAETRNVLRERADERPVMGTSGVPEAASLKPASSTEPVQMNM